MTVILCLEVKTMQISKRRYAALFNRLTHIIQELQEIQRESDEIFFCHARYPKATKSRGRVVCCQNNFCIYWSSSLCTLDEITLGVQGSCQACIYVTITEDVLQKERESILKND